MIKGGNPSFIESYQTNEFNLCDDIIAKFEEFNSSVEPSVHGHVMDGTVMNGGLKNRKDRAFDFLSLQEPLIQPMHEVLKRYVDIYCEKYIGFGMKSSMSRHMKVQKTEPKGGFYMWHSEHSHGDQASYRSLVWTFYLNDIPDGEGETEFIESTISTMSVKCIGGRALVFPPMFPWVHCGRKPVHKPKYLLQSYLHYTLPNGLTKSESEMLVRQGKQQR